jgi:hypothetical protein
MPLTCYCIHDNDYEWYYEPPQDYTTMPKRSRRVRCSSCKTLINPEDIVTEFPRERPTRGDIEEKIYGDLMPISSMWMCEDCSDMYFNFRALGFQCLSPDENMQDLLVEYRNITNEELK